ncbi:MAG: GAF domain-containing sensor histidine kinase [Bacteroidales bacterium]
MENKNYSRVNVRETNEEKQVRIASVSKPKPGDEIIEKWQSLLNLTAKIMNVSSALIMKLNKKSIEVFLKSQTEGNPYKVGGKEELVYGLYCETVIGKQKKLLVSDATKSPVWKDNNPDIDLNMISYLGFPLNYPDGEVFGTVCVLDNEENHYSSLYEDLLDKVKQHIETDLKLLVTNKELKEKTEQLERSNELKSNFLSLISHDIRGSVSSLDEFIKFLISSFQKYKRDELQDKLKIIRITTNSLYQTLQNLLNWSKNDLLQLEAQKEQVDLISIIGEILDFLKPRIEFKELEVYTEFAYKTKFVLADPNMLATSLRNIISNAIKFTDPKGKIFIRVFEKDEQTVIEIEDTGIGMDKESVNKLFTYIQSKQDEDNNQGGSGLGLLLSKEFLDKNNATVYVFSEKGQGTKFIIRI